MWHSSGVDSSGVDSTPRIKVLCAAYGFMASCALSQKVEPYILKIASRSRKLLQNYIVAGLFKYTLEYADAHTRCCKIKPVKP